MSNINDDHNPPSQSTGSRSSFFGHTPDEEPTPDEQLEVPTAWNSVWPKRPVERDYTTRVFTRPGLHLRWPKLPASADHHGTLLDKVRRERVKSFALLSAMRQYDNQLSAVAGEADWHHQLSLSLDPNVVSAIPRPSLDNSETVETSLQEALSASPNDRQELQLFVRVGRREIYLDAWQRAGEYLSTTGYSVKGSKLLDTIRTWSRKPPRQVPEDALREVWSDEELFRQHVTSVAELALDAFRLDYKFSPVVEFLDLTGPSAEAFYDQPSMRDPTDYS